MLTIISVSYKSKALLKANYELVKAMNPNTPFKWIVVQNTPARSLKEDLSMDDPDFIMIKGAVLTKHEIKYYGASLHHAKALNLALSYTDAEIVLTLDPDCFIFMPNWIELVTKYLKQKKLFFLGSPYDPKLITHYREFPNAICMFIHRSLMQEKNHYHLDFTPNFEREISNKSRHSAISYLKLFGKRYFKRLFTIFEFYTQPKTLDTGYRVHERYRSLKKHEIFKMFVMDKRSFKKKFFESFLPDSYRTFPRSKTLISKKSSPLFAEFPDTEQFYWNDQPFAIHLKGHRDISKKAKNLLQSQVLKKIKEYIHDEDR